MTLYSNGGEIYQVKDRSMITKRTWNGKVIQSFRHCGNNAEHLKRAPNDPIPKPIGN